MNINIEMGLGKKGSIGSMGSLTSPSSYWSDGYWSESYWSPDYWAEIAGGDWNGTSFNKSETASFNIAVTPYAAAGVDRTVDIYFSGGHSDKEDHGLGKHYSVTESLDAVASTYVSYNLTKVTVTILAESAAAVNIPVTIVNNGNLEPSRVITVYGAGAPKTFTIVDDSGGTAWNGVTDFAEWGGATGLVAGSEDYATANTTTLNALHTWCATNLDPTTDQLIVYVPNGTYYLDINTNLWPGVIFWGQSKNGVIFQRPSKTWYIAQGYPTANEPALTYWYPLFRSLTTAGHWEDATDTKKGGFVNCSFDGNYDSFWPFSLYTCYEKSHFILFSNAGELEGRNSCLLENVDFANNITSNYSTGSNTIFTVYNVSHSGGVDGKGDFSYVGGNIESVHRAESTVRQIDYEQNAAGYGYYLDYRQTVIMTDCNIRLNQFGLQYADTDTFIATDVNTTTNLIALASTFSTGHAVVFSTTDTLPAPLAIETVYYLAESGTTNTFGVRETPAGANIDLTDGGTGTHTVAVNFGTQTFTFNQCDIQDQYVLAPSATIAINGGTITPVDYGSGGSKTYLFGVGSYTATGTTINMAEGTQATRGGIPWLHSYNPDSIWKFDTCTFNKVGTWVLPACVFNNTSISLNLLGELLLDTCTFNNFSGSDDWIVYFGSGGRVSIIEPTLVNCTNFVNFYGYGPSYYGKLSVTGPFTADALAIYYLARAASLTGDYRSNVLEHVLDGGAATVILPSTQALIMSGQAASDGAGIKEFTFIGKRRITSAVAPETTNTGLPGDEWYNTVSSAVTHTVVVTGDYDEVNSGWKKVRDTAPIYYDTTWTAA